MNFKEFFEANEIPDKRKKDQNIDWDREDKWGNLSQYDDDDRYYGSTYKTDYRSVLPASILGKGGKVPKGMTVVDKKKILGKEEPIEKYVDNEKYAYNATDDIKIDKIFNIEIKKNFYEETVFLAKFDYLTLKLPEDKVIKSKLAYYIGKEYKKRIDLVINEIKSNSHLRDRNYLILEFFTKGYEPEYAKSLVSNYGWHSNLDFFKSVINYCVRIVTPVIQEKLNFGPMGGEWDSASNHRHYFVKIEDHSVDWRPNETVPEDYY